MFDPKFLRVSTLSLALVFNLIVASLGFAKDVIILHTGKMNNKNQFSKENNRWQLFCGVLVNSSKDGISFSFDRDGESKKFIHLSRINYIWLDVNEKQEEKCNTSNVSIAKGGVRAESTKNPLPFFPGILTKYYYNKNNKVITLLKDTIKNRPSPGFVFVLRNKDQSDITQLLDDKKCLVQKPLQGSPYFFGFIDGIDRGMFKVSCISETSLFSPLRITSIDQPIDRQYIKWLVQYGWLLEYHWCDSKDRLIYNLYSGEKKPSQFGECSR